MKKGKMVEKGTADSAWVLTAITWNQHPDKDNPILRLFEREELEVLEDRYGAGYFAVADTQPNRAGGESAVLDRGELDAVRPEGQYTFRAFGAQYIFRVAGAHCAGLVNPFLQKPYLTGLF